MLKASLIQQIKCRYREFRREPSAFYWVVFMPLMWMLVLGFAFSKPQIERYGVGISGASAPELETTLQEKAQFQLKKGTTEELIRWIKRGDIVLIVDRLPDRSLRFEFDPSNPVAARARDAINNELQVAEGRKDVLSSTSHPLEAEGGRYIDFLIPGLLGLSIMTSSLFGVGMTIVSNRKENLLKRYLLTPMRSYEYIVSHLVGRMLVLGAEFLSVMVAGFLIFRFRLYGSWIEYILFSILGAAAFTSMALLCASRTRSIPMISGLTNLISLPMMMLSGVFFSKNNFPDWLYQIAHFLPLSLINDGLRKIALEGARLSELGFELSVLGLYTLVFSILAQKFFRWT